MRFEFHAPRCRDCGERMRWVSDEAISAECSWCEEYGKPIPEDY